MAKFCGKVGYSVTRRKNDVSYEEYVERLYYGDVLKNHNSPQAGESIIDDIRLNNQISIIADGFAMQSFASIKYAEYMGVKWKVTSVDVQYPRLILSFGGVFNGA